MDRANLSNKVSIPTAKSGRGMLAKRGRTLPSETALKTLLLFKLKAKDNATKE